MRMEDDKFGLIIPAGDCFYRGVKRKQDATSTTRPVHVCKSETVAEWYLNHGPPTKDGKKGYVIAFKVKNKCELLLYKVCPPFFKWLKQMYAKDLGKFASPKTIPFHEISQKRLFQISPILQQNGNSEMRAFGQGIKRLAETMEIKFTENPEETEMKHKTMSLLYHSTLAALEIKRKEGLISYEEHNKLHKIIQDTDDLGLITMLEKSFTYSSGTLKVKRYKEWDMKIGTEFWSLCKAEGKCDGLLLPGDEITAEEVILFPSAFDKVTLENREVEQD